MILGHAPENIWNVRISLHVCHLHDADIACQYHSCRIKINWCITIFNWDKRFLFIYLLLLFRDIFSWVIKWENIWNRRISGYKHFFLHFWECFKIKIWPRATRSHNKKAKYNLKQFKMLYGCVIRLGKDKCAVNYYSTMFSYRCWRHRLGWAMLTVHSKMSFNRPDKHGNRWLRCSSSSSLRSPYTIGAKHCARLKNTKLMTAKSSLVSDVNKSLFLRICRKNSIKFGRM